MATNQFSEGSALLISVVNVVDAAGNPATLSTPPVWSSSDTTILNPVATDPTGLNAAGTLLKTGTVTVTATSGSISASVAITGIAGQAVSFSLSVALAPPAGTPPVTSQTPAAS